MKRLLVAIVLALPLVVPAAANADVLVNGVPSRLVCGDAIQLGIWAQAGTTGSRTVSMTAIDRASGRTWWRKTATASTSGWRYWVLPSGRNGQCGRTKIVYHLLGSRGWYDRYNVRFTSEGV